MTPDAMLWLDRDRLELYAVACLALGQQPMMPGPSGPSLAIHRRLKEAALFGGLTVTLNGTQPNVNSTVTPPDLRSYATARNDKMLISQCNKWENRLADGPSFPTVMEKSRGGRPAQYPWNDAFWPAVVLEIYTNGFPETLAELVEKLAQWCTDNWEKEPGETTLKGMLRPLWKRWKDEGGN